MTKTKLNLLLLPLVLSAATSANRALAGEQAASQPTLDATDRQIPAGCVGYVVFLPAATTLGIATGGYVGCYKGPMTYPWKMFYNVHVNLINVAPFTYDEEFNILTKDKLKMDFHVRITIKVKDPVEASTQQIVDHYQGKNWYAAIVQPNVQAYVREATTGVDSFDLNDKEKRQYIENDIKGKLDKFFGDKPFEVTAVNINRVEYPPQYVELIEQTAMLEQKKAQATLQEQTAQAQEKANIAQAEADGAGIVKRAEKQAEAQSKLNATLTPLAIEYQAMMALRDLVNSTNHATIYIPVGAGGIPLIPTITTDNVKK